MRKLALDVLSRLPLEALCGSLNGIVASVRDVDKDVRRSAHELVGRLDTSALRELSHTSLDVVFSCVLDGDVALPQWAHGVIAKMDAETFELALDNLCSARVECRRKTLDIISKLAPPLLTEYCVRCSGSTPLHTAASEGHLEACQVLVQAGSSIRMRNKAGETPLDLATKNRHRKVIKFLSKQSVFTTTRGGSGDAFEQAIRDSRCISKVAWYTMALPGVAGQVGVRHSLFAVTAGESPLQYIYVIEKAAPTAECNVEAFKNGVYLSHGADVLPGMEKAADCTLEAHELLNNTGKSEFTMKVLRDLAVDLGPYNVGTCNCHHAALAVYNACARPAAQRKWMPNHFYSLGASILQGAGVDVLQSESTLSRLDSASMVFTSRSTASDYTAGAFPINSQDRGVDHRSLVAARLSAWIYTPQCALQSHGSNVECSLVLHNGMSEELTAFVEETEATMNLKPGSCGHLEVQDAIVHVRISQSGSSGLTSYRIPFTRHTLSRGRTYTIKLRISGEVVCKQRDPLPDHVHVKHLERAENGHLVQWAVATTEEDIFLVFKGSSDILDAAVDFGFLTHDDALHGLRVHSGMWNALNQRHHRVIDVAFDAVRRELGSNPRQVVLCGHSLGGGYAILCALELLHRKVLAPQVIAFGTPQVVVPPACSSPLWQDLNDATTVFVNAYDMIPRLPSCTDWLAEALPHCLAKSIGPFKVSGHLSAKLGKVVDWQRDFMRVYQPIGTLTFISDDSHAVQRVKSSCEHGKEPAHMDLLCSKPRRFGTFVMEQHSCGAYIAVLHKLVARADCLHL